MDSIQTTRPHHKAMFLIYVSLCTIPDISFQISYHFHKYHQIIWRIDDRYIEYKQERRCRSGRVGRHWRWVLQLRWFLSHLWWVKDAPNYLLITIKLSGHAAPSFAVNNLLVVKSSLKVVKRERIQKTGWHFNGIVSSSRTSQSWKLMTTKTHVFAFTCQLPWSIKISPDLVPIVYRWPNTCLLSRLSFLVAEQFKSD